MEVIDAIKLEEDKYFVVGPYTALKQQQQQQKPKPSPIPVLIISSWWRAPTIFGMFVQAELAPVARKTGLALLDTFASRPPMLWTI